MTRIRHRHRPEEGRVKIFGLLAHESESTVICMSEPGKGRDSDAKQGGTREPEKSRYPGHCDDRGKNDQTVRHELPKDFGVSDTPKAPPRKQ